MGVEQSYALEATFHGEAPEVVATVHVHDPRGLSIETEVGVQDCRVVGVAHRLKGAGAGKALGYGTMDVAMAEVAAADRADR